MVQQQVKSVWQHMVGVMCLNMTHRKQVKKVLPILFKKYPNAKSFLQGKSEDQEKLLQSRKLAVKKCAPLLFRTFYMIFSFHNFYLPPGGHLKTRFLYILNFVL